jgi:D-arginine dehydrogenase
MTLTTDVLVLGAGMAGASLAAELASHCGVILLEVEEQAGRHATGRSAAMFFETYGNATVRALTRASRGFFEEPPAGFAEVPIFRPRGALFVADRPREEKLAGIASLSDAATPMQRLDAAAARRICPILREDWVAAAVLDTSGQDIDVAAVHQGYLRQARRQGACFVANAAQTTIERRDGSWQVCSAAGSFAAPVLVNATGAWADTVARRAGVRPIGLMPLRRTCVTISLVPEYDIRDWPLVIDVDEEFYFKPDAGQLLVSPANEDLSEPCDAVPDELDVAVAIDRFERATSIEVKRLNHRWAGLRSFVADRSPVAGFDDEAEGFFWLVGQGGYGIQMAPALARAAAALVRGKPLPGGLEQQGVTLEALSPSRPGLRTTTG